MDLVIKQNVNQQENGNSALLDLLYNLTKPDPATGQAIISNATLVGRISVPAAYEDAVNFLNTHFSVERDNGSDFQVFVLNNNYYIRFADSAVEETLKLNMGKDEGEGITLAEASNTVANYFQNNTVIENFDELKYFKTGSYIFRGCSALKSIDITGKESQVDCYDNKSIEYFYGINGPKGFLSTSHSGTNFTGCWGITTLELTCTSNTQVNSYRSMSGLQTLIWKVSPGVVLGSYTFYGASLLERVVVDDLDSFWTHNMGWGSGSPFQNKIAKLIVNDVEVTSVTVPQTISQIQPGNWCGARLTSCVFHSSVTSIGTHAFDGCDLLVIQDLNLPSLASLGSYAFQGTKVQTISDLGSVTSIPEGCFKGCSQLTTIDQGVLDKITVLGKEAFNNCTSLGSAKQSDNTISSVLRLPNLTSIALDAVRYTKFTEIADLGNITTVTGFSEMYSLTSVVLPQTCTTIGDSAFVSDKALTTINLNNITSIGASAFNGCDNLIYFHGDGSAAGELNLSNVTFIGKFAFQNCKKLASLTFSNSVTSIGENAFNSCSGLTSITIPNSVTSIGGGAFRNCSSLTSVTIGNSVTSIGGSAFRDCSGLTSINLNNITNIGNAAFQGCTNLIYFHGTGSIAGELNLSNVISIGNETFNSCNGLTSITIGNNATSIGYSAFFGCIGLTSVVIPNSMTNIGNMAFYSCSSLTSVTINAVTPPTLGISVFNGTNNCSIYVPAGSVEAYKTADGWKDIPNADTRIKAIET